MVSGRAMSLRGCGHTHGSLLICSFASPHNVESSLVLFARSSVALIPFEIILSEGRGELIAAGSKSHQRATHVISHALDVLPQCLGLIDEFLVPRQVESSLDVQGLLTLRSGLVQTARGRSQGSARVKRAYKCQDLHGAVRYFAVV